MFQFASSFERFIRCLLLNDTPLLADRHLSPLCLCSAERNVRMIKNARDLQGTTDYSKLSSRLSVITPLPTQKNPAVSYAETALPESILLDFWNSCINTWAESTMKVCSGLTFKHDLILTLTREIRLTQNRQNAKLPAFVPWIRHTNMETQSRTRGRNASSTLDCRWVYLELTPVYKK